MFSRIVYLRTVACYAPVCIAYNSISYTLLVVQLANLLEYSYIASILSREAIIEVINNLGAKLLTKKNN